MAGIWTVAGILVGLVLLRQQWSSDTFIAALLVSAMCLSPVFLLGKVLNALLLDPVRYDLSVLARFNAFVCASMCKTAEELQGDRERAVDYFVAQYKRMFEENLDDYTNNFSKYMRPEK